MELPSMEPAEEPENLGLTVLANLVRSSADGIAVMDEDRRYLYANPAACRLLEAPLRDLTGQAAPFPERIERAEEDSLAPGRHRHGALSIRLPGGGMRELEFEEIMFDTVGRVLTAVTFRDVTEMRRHERQLAAFARTVTSLAGAGSLQPVLNRVATDVLLASGFVASSVVVFNPETHGVQMVGTAGYPTRFVAERMEQCRRNGAPLFAVRAYESRQPVVSRYWRTDALHDPRCAPLHDILDDLPGEGAVAVPLIARDDVVGALSGVFPPGWDPSEDDIVFLTAMADYAAVAVDNARLFSEFESKVALEERHRLARELHDSVSQALFSMTLHTRALEVEANRGGGESQHRLASGLAELRQLIQAALTEMRALIFQLRPDALRQEGLVAAVHKHAAAVAAREGIDVRVRAPEHRMPLSDTAEEELLRVVQEALNNTVKHARASCVDIRVEELGDDPTALVVEVADDGHGFDPLIPHPGHLGLHSMRERVERLGGRLTVGSAPGTSTTIRAVLPGALRSPPNDRPASQIANGDDTTGRRR